MRAPACCLPIGPRRPCMLIFKSRTHVAALRRRTETAIEVAGVLVGGDPGAAVVEVFDVIDAAFPASA